MTTISHTNGYAAAQRGEFRATTGLSALTPEYDQWLAGYDSATAKNANPCLTPRGNLRKHVIQCNAAQA